MITESVDLAALEQRRQSLALDALEGREGAATELADIEAQIAALKVAAERTQLAEKERLARAEAEARALEEERRREMQAQLAELWQHRGPLAAEIEEATEALASAVSRLFLVGDQIVRLNHNLHGRLNNRLGMRDAVRGYLLWKLSADLPELGRPDRFYRRPLREILAGQIVEAE